MSLVDSLAQIRQLVVVVGCQRSGTTLTAQILGSDTSAFLIDEFDGLYEWFHSLPTMGKSINPGLIKKAATKYKSDLDRISIHLASCRLGASIETLVLKAPNLTFDEAALSALDMPVTIIYPIRDPRAVVASMQRLNSIDFVGNQLKLIEMHPEIGREYAAEVAQIRDSATVIWIKQALVWKIKSGRAASFAQAALPTHSFRYEDLVRDPVRHVSILKKVAGFREPDSTYWPVYVGLGPGETDRTRPIDTASMLNFRDCLTIAQQRDVLTAAAPLAYDLGYV